MTVDDDEEADMVAQCQKALATGEKLTTYFEDALDDIYGPSKPPTVSTSEQERIDREDEAFRIMLRKAIATNLKGQGFHAVRVEALEGGYQIQTLDSEGRRYDVAFEFELLDECEGSVRELFARLTAAILAERERYFRRMQ